MSIDTAHLRFPISPTSTQLESWASHHLCYPNEKVWPKYFQNASMDSGARVDFIYYPSNSKYKEDAILVQVSLPKALFGNNVQLIEDDGQLQEAIQEVNRFISSISWMPSIDLKEGRLCRLDLTYNHHIGDRVPDYTKALSNMKCSGRKTKPYPSEGVEFRSNVVRTIFYDKHLECHLPSALGILRQETSLRGGSYIAECMGEDNPYLKYVTRNWALSILDHDLKILGLKDRIVYDRDSALERLIKNYGFNLGTSLYGHWLAYQSMSREQMIAYGASERTIRERNKKITDIGIAMTSTEGKISLPPLVIDYSGNKTYVSLK